MKLMRWKAEEGWRLMYVIRVVDEVEGRGRLEVDVREVD